MKTTTNQNEIIRVIASSFGLEILEINNGLGDESYSFYLKSDLEVEKGIDNKYYHENSELSEIKQVIFKDNYLKIDELCFLTKNINNFAEMLRETIENEIERTN